jgi:hypothetical protein
MHSALEVEKDENQRIEKSEEIERIRGRNLCGLRLV